MGGTYFPDGKSRKDASWVAYKWYGPGGFVYLTTSGNLLQGLLLSLYKIRHHINFDSKKRCLLATISICSTFGSSETSAAALT